MIDIPDLKEAVGKGRDWVIVDPDGTMLDMAVPTNAGPATILVSRVTDALKRVGDATDIEGSVDRDRLWAVDAFVLNREVLSQLEGEPVDARTLIETVPETGFGWQVVVGYT